jgi:hypothetical protein
MAKSNNQLPDQETIERYYGTLEAYLEEQRRTALVDLEESSTKPLSNWNWDYARRFRRNPRLGKAPNSQNSTRSFHLFGRNN